MVVVARAEFEGLRRPHAVDQGLHRLLGGGRVVAVLEQLQELAAGGDVLDQTVTVLQTGEEDLV